MAMISCISDEFSDQGQNDDMIDIQFAVSDFPGYGNTRAIGIQDEGKTSWNDGDVILVSITSGLIGTQTTALTYKDGCWTEEDDCRLSCQRGETPSISAIYAPCNELDSETGAIVLKSGMKPGMEEHLTAECSIEDEVIHIDFSDASRNYSRLRIAVVPEAELTVTIGSATSSLSFIPAGTDESVENGETYTLDTDDKGNAYLYGTFAADATINVRCNGILLTDFRFRADRFANGTVPGKSYALNAIPPYPLSAQHYISLKDAFDDINNATLGANATLRNWITVPLTSNGQPI